jgi:hypothetical protein
MTVKNYDADQVDVIFPIPLDGFADGSKVTIEISEDTFVLKRGNGGTFTRSKIKGRAGIATIRLMQSSLSNAVLSALHEADYLAPNGAGIAPILVRDRQSAGTLLAAAEAWIIKTPDQEFDETATPREWKIQFVHPKVFIGGNT